MAFEGWPVLLASLMLVASSAGVTCADDSENGETGESSVTSPLERLRTRSADERWHKLKRRLKPRGHWQGKNRAVKSAPAQSPLLPALDKAPPPAPISDDGTNIPTSTVLGWVPTGVGEDRRGAANETASPLYAETAIDQIQPYFDYEPLRVAAQEKDCETICPCANGADCRKPGTTKPCPCPEDDIQHPWIAKTYTPRAFDKDVFNWDASNVYSYPLYFEDKALERYGHTHYSILQPVMSISQFGAQLALLPYQMALKPPLHPRYSLGYYRPGEWTPKLHYQIPLNAKAGLVQAGVVTGAFFIFP